MKMTHKDVLLKLDTFEGIWYFLLVKTKEEKILQ